MKLFLSIQHCALFCLVFIVDQISKYWILTNISWYPITSFFSLYVVKNTGISWGIADGWGNYTHIFIMGIILMMISMILYQGMLKLQAKRIIIPEVIICGAAFSNLFDRLWYGGVIDFLSFQIGSWQFPIFNIADIMIVAGIGFILFNELYYHE